MHTVKPSGSISERFDPCRVDALRSLRLPTPIHAVNYVRFQSVPLYRLYSILLLPYAIPKGVRPVWVASREETLVGGPDDDEIVIVEYPDHGTLLDVLTSRYYGYINGLRERGVERLGFSINEQLQPGMAVPDGGSVLGKGTHLVLRFATTSASVDIFDAVLQLTRPLGPPEYASREVARLDIFPDPLPTDPTAVEMSNILVFPAGVSDSDVLDVVASLSHVDGVEFEVHRYRTFGVPEALGLRRGVMNKRRPG